MKRALVLLVGCSGAPMQAPPDATPRALDLDIVVSPQVVRVFANDTDSDDPNNTFDVLPGDGVCVGDGDVLGNQTTCLEQILLLDGSTVVKSLDPGERGERSFQVRGLAVPQVELVGCGGHATIPVSGAAITAETLSIAKDATARTLTATWGGSTAAMLVFGDGTFDQRCRTSASPYAFTVPDLGPPVDGFIYFTAQGLDGPTIVDTTFGPARVWRGDEASAQ